MHIHAVVVELTHDMTSRMTQRRPPPTVENDAERDERVESLEDDRRLDHAIVVQLAQELHTAHASLVELGVIHLQTEANVLQQAVDDAYGDALLSDR